MNLSDLLHDAVDGIEPADRIDEIRARTATTPARAARPWFYAAGGVVLATAATVAGFAILDSSPPQHDHGSMDMPAPAETQLVAAYFVGDTEDGPRLYREFDEVPADQDPLQAALDRIQQSASDPDYRTRWPAGSFGEVTVRNDQIDVDLGSADRVRGLAAQQVVYTLQAAAGRQLPVYFWRDGQRGNAPVTAAAMGETLNRVSISDPAEGNEYAGSFTARGRVETHSWVEWALSDSAGETVRHGTGVVTDPQATFSPWTAEIDLSGLTPGTYTFTATTDTDAYTFPSTDTRTITVR